MDKYNAEQKHSIELTLSMDTKIIRAIRHLYGFSDEADALVEHFYNTVDDAESYFGRYEEDRASTMYSGDFTYRLEDIEIKRKLANDRGE